MSAREFLIARTELLGGQDAAGMVSAMTAGFTEADWAGVDVMRREAWPGDATIDLTALAAAGFPKVVAIGAWDPAVHPTAAKIPASEHHRATAAEHRALARRINGRLVTFSRSMHAPMVEEPDAFNALLRDTWRATRPAPSAAKNPGAGRPGR